MTILLQRELEHENLPRRFILLQNGLSIPRHFYALDVSRALAALAVVFSHFSHFYHHPAYQTAGRVRPVVAEPFHNLLWPLYDHGGLAVQYFFVLSGFIFFWLYFDPIRSRKLDLWHFFVLRFSRLYPLHLLTLFLVCIGQWITVATWGEPFIYPYNDLRHFVLQLGLASDWGFEVGASFNGPVWSVSLEVIAYATFFVVALILPRSFFVIAGLGIIAFAVMRYQNFRIGMVLACFFSGGLAAEALRLLLVYGNRKRAFAVLVFLMLAVVGSGILLFDIPGISRIRNELIWGCTLPAMVLGLAIIQCIYPKIFTTVGSAGDITYASYLLHFPIQLILAPLFIVIYGEAPGLWLLGVYLAAVIVLSLISYGAVEMPAQKWLRKLLSTRGQPGSLAAGTE